ncbi:MAG: hypothetical protein IJ770_03380 [Alphaproteobacteria bacterium]|nr:hypothetical protein [Alphaproteobacteria bacterium]
MEQIAFWIGFFVGRFIAAIMILSLVLAFVRNQTRTKIILSGVVGCLFATFISFAGDINGRLLTWFLTEFLLLMEFIPLLAVFALATFLTVWRRWNTQEWFAKKLPWLAGILYGFILILALPAEVKEQMDIRQIAQEMTLRQFFALPNDQKADIAAKIAGVKDGYLFDCIRANQNSQEAQNFLLKEVIDVCRDLVRVRD